MAEKFKATSFKEIKLEDMVNYILENHPEDKAWFKEVAYQDKNGKDLGKYNHLNAVRQFCGKYAKDLIPVAKEKGATPTDLLKDW